MPKENINCSQDERQRAEVHWVPEKYVQLATVRRHEDKPEYEQVEGVYLDLDRAGINRLIRSLRRARDAAFGADA